MASQSLTPYQIIAAQAAQWRKIIHQAAVEHRCCIPGFLVEDMDPDSQTATVQIAIQEQVRQSTGAEWWDVAPIIRVPILIPRGGGWSITLPLKHGDQGALIFCDACFDLWFLNGTTNSPPADNTGIVSGSQRQLEVRRHHFWDCGFLPSSWSQPNALSDYSTDSMQIRSDDGTTVIDIAASGITITSPNEVQITAPAINANESSGTPQKLVTDAFYQWFETNVLPFLVSKGYSGPNPPTNSETSVLKGQ